MADGSKSRRLFGIMGFLLIIAALATLFAVLRENLVLEPYHFIDDQGALGALYLCLFMVLWIVCGFPSTVIEVLAGFMYGFGWGVLIGFVGKQVAATISFTVGRRLALRWSTRLQKRYLLLRAMNTALRECTRRVLFLVCIAYIPAAIKNYGLALFQSVSFVDFQLAIALAGTPYVLMSTWFGATSYSIIEVVRQQQSTASQQGTQGETVSALKIVMMSIGGASSAVLLVVLAIYGRRARRELVERAELEDAAALEAAAREVAAELAEAAYREEEARSSFDFVKSRLPLDDTSVQGEHVPPFALRDRKLRRSLSADSRLALPPHHYHPGSDFFAATHNIPPSKTKPSQVKTARTADAITLLMLQEEAEKDVTAKPKICEQKSLRDSRPIAVLPQLKKKASSVASSSTSRTSGPSRSVSSEIKEEKVVVEAYVTQKSAAPTTPENKVPITVKPKASLSPPKQAASTELSISGSRSQSRPPTLTFWEMLEKEDSVCAPEEEVEPSKSTDEIEQKSPFRIPETRLDIPAESTLGSKQLHPTTIKLSPRGPKSHARAFPLARDRPVDSTQCGSFAQSHIGLPSSLARSQNSSKPSRFSAFRNGVRSLAQKRNKKPQKMSKRIKEAQKQLAKTSHMYGSPDTESHCMKHTEVRAHLERERQYRYLAKMLAGAVPSEPVVSTTKAQSYKRHRRSSIM